VSANYQSYTGHAGIGIKRLIPLQLGLTLSPTLRLDYGEVRADAYRESGAGGLNLNVDSQTYRELIVHAGLKGWYRIARDVSLIAEAGLGYNTIRQGLQITAAFAGGGDSFVTRGIEVSPWLYSGGLGFTANPGDKFDLSVRYGVQATTSGYLQQSGSLLLKLKI
jgi:outer membrane autotransporter protein